MYEQFFGLRERPFDLTPNPRFLVLTESHREALSNLEYGIASRKGITLLVGEAGSGKTTLIRAAIEQAAGARALRAPAQPDADARRVRRDAGGAVRAVGRGVAVEGGACCSSSRRCCARGARAARPPCWSSTRRRACRSSCSRRSGCWPTSRRTTRSCCSVILAGQPELAERLNDQSLRQLKQRIALRCELRPLTLQETAGYIAGRIRAAGGMGAQVFTREAVALIHERRAGIPRTISVIADNALLGGFAAGQRPVGQRARARSLPGLRPEGHARARDGPDGAGRHRRRAGRRRPRRMEVTARRQSALLDLADRLRYAPRPTAPAAGSKPATRWLCRSPARRSAESCCLSFGAEERS